MKQFDHISDYIKAAPKRLDDAWELLERPTWEPERRDARHRHHRGAVYLAGYAVECALKAYVISRVPGTQRFDDALAQRQQAGEMLPVLRGKQAHSLARLLRATDLEAAMDAQVELKKDWGAICQKWNPNLRYDPTHWTDRAAARRFVAGVDRVYRWVDERRSAEEGDGQHVGAEVRVRRARTEG